VYIVLKLGQDKVHVNPLFLNGFVIKLSLRIFSFLKQNEVIF